MNHIAVIDTETNWENRVMSIGAVIADADTLRPVSARYFILTPEYQVGGIFSHVLFPNDRLKPIVCSRAQAMESLLDWLTQYRIDSVFAYNAIFDHKHLPELGCFQWYDIMRLAAYRQYNRKIPPTAQLCSTGRLKRSYGVEPMLQLLSGDCSYRETHNALFDAMDELRIMQLLEHPLSDYIPL